MTPAPQSRVLELLAAARELSGAQRAAFLEIACAGDAEMRAEVEKLLADPLADTVYAPQMRTQKAVLVMTEIPPGAHMLLTADMLLGPYRIEAQIGAGGMGVVYKAHDTRLARSVAIKAVHPNSASPQLEAAFLREARLASSLNHSGIVTIYDILSHGGTTYIVMEFVQGRPLGQVIPESGLAMDRALSLASAIGDAVSAAHAAGIVHRDLKPANILVRDDGQIKILDFGLAKISRFSEVKADPQTASIFGNSAVGTIGYMAPEQARGEEVDERADIYSFGVILYQMLAGRMPFEAVNIVALHHSMETMEPAPLRGAKPGIPAALENVVLRALAAKPSERHQTMRAMLAEMRTSPGHSSSGQLLSGNSTAEASKSRTIAVLPLINISPDPENEYICDGLAEELIDGLTQIPGLRVVSRSSSFQCKGTTPDVREIGRRLRASLLLHGSLRRSGDRLRLNLQLSQTDDGYQIWSQRFDAQVQDLFALQDELTEAVLEKLRQQLGASFPAMEAEKPMPNPKAYNFYLQGRFAFNRETPADFRQALDLFGKSAVADPTFAPALIGIAETHMRLDWYGLERAAVAIPVVKRALAFALDLQPDSVAGLCNLAITQAGWDWDWAAAGRTFDRILTASGSLASVHFHYGLDFLTPLGRLEEALRHLRRALQLDPLSPIAQTAVGGCLYRMRRYDEAAETLHGTLKSTPEFGHAHWSLGRVLLEQGRHEEALKQFEDAARIMGQIPAALAELGYCHGRMGRRDLAQVTLQELQRLTEQTWVSPVNVALVYTGLGEDIAAIEHLEQALEKRIRQLVWVNVDPRNDTLRPHPRFEQLISRIGLSPLEVRP
jgi:serine/threonine protein kinase/Flp pilus assembly protein TadD